MKCAKCGYESSVPFTACPSCGMSQPVQLQYYNVPTVAKKRSVGEKVAIGVGIAVSSISLIAAFLIFMGYGIYLQTKVLTDDSFGIDAFDDFDSNEYGDEVEDFFNGNGDTESGNNSSSGLNSPLSFKETLYSFSEGEVQTEYEVSMVQTYRGEAALKLLKGETLPYYNSFSNEIYLVKFKIVITDQDKDAIVPMPNGNPRAYREGTVSLLSDSYDTVDGLSYANRLKLIKKGEEVETWMAFIVNKNDGSPCIRWNGSENKVFRHIGQSVASADEVEAGAAIELTSSDSSADDTTSE